MNEWIAITFRSGTVQEPGVVPPCNFKSVAGARRPHEQGLDAVNRIVYRACGTRHIEDHIQSARIKRLRNIVAEELKVRFRMKMLYICDAASQQVVDPKHRIALGEKRVDH